MGNISIWAILLAAVAYMALGFFWYGPLFGKEWLRFSGATKKEIAEAKKRGKKGMMPVFIAGFLASLVTASVLAYVMKFLYLKTMIAGALIGALLWLGFIATVQLNSVLWMKKPKELFFIDALHYLAGMMLMGAILGAF